MKNIYIFSNIYYCMVVIKRKQMNLNGEKRRGANVEYLANRTPDEILGY